MTPFKCISVRGIRAPPRWEQRQCRLYKPTHKNPPLVKARDSLCPIHTVLEYLHLLEWPCFVQWAPENVGAMNSTLLRMPQSTKLSRVASQFSKTFDARFVWWELGNITLGTVFFLRLLDIHPVTWSLGVLHELACYRTWFRQGLWISFPSPVFPIYYFKVILPCYIFLGQI